MNGNSMEMGRFESLLANVLNYGTLVASAIIAIGLMLTSIDRHTHHPARSMFSSGRIVMAGIGCFILLPVVRVVLMLMVFARRRDYRFVAIAATVLTVIFMGFLLGLYLSRVAA